MNCGQQIHVVKGEESFIYPCHLCGFEIEMGSCAKPLTMGQWIKVQRRLLGDLNRKLDIRKDIRKLIKVNQEMSKLLKEISSEVC